MNLYYKFLYSLTLACILTFNLLAQPKQNPKKKLFIMEIKAEIDPRMNRYVELAFKDAEEQNADIIIIEMDTYGGVVTDADDIRTKILNHPKPVWVFINKDAASAGALISIACDSIFMAPGASIGAATVVTADGQAAPDKYQSYMRSIMRSTAEANGRDPHIAEAMVDERIEIDSITKAGEVVTFSTTEAIKFGFCEARVASIDEIIKMNNLEDYERINYKLETTEKIIAFFLNPFISGILILVIIGGLYFELQTPGVGFPLLASAIALVLYLTPYYLNGLAANWEIIAFFIGLILISLEIFVIPGFGVAGISGIALTITSLILMMVNNDAFDFSFVAATELVRAALAAMAGLLGGIVLIFVGGAKFTNSRMFSRIALEDVQDSTKGYTSRFTTEALLGKRGITYTVLRPSGKVMIEGTLYDAYSRGDYIERGKEVIVIEESGTSLKVKETEVL